MLNAKTLQKAREIASRFRDQGLRAVPKGKTPAKVFAKAADNSRGELYIYEQIGLDCWTGSGITAKGVAEALDAMKGVKALDVYINSEGGDAFEGIAIHSQLKRFAAEKVCYVDGLAASAASVIAMSGDRVVMATGSSQMCHSAWSMAVGNADDMRAYADVLELLDGNIADIYSAKTGKSKEECLALMRGEDAQDGTWMDAAKAVELGFADEASTDDGDDDQTGNDNAKAAATAAMRIVSVTQERIRAARASSQIALMENRSKKPPGQPGKTA